MKKLIFTALSSLAMISVFAQGIVESNSPRFRPVGNEPVSRSQHSKVYGKTYSSEWYEPYDFAGKAGASSSWTRYVNFLFPDTLVKIIDNTGEVSYMPGATNVGQVVDPKDDNIDQIDNPSIKMTKFTSYTLDSIYFQYLYVRNVDSVPDPGNPGFNAAVVDTLVIYYYVPAGLKTYTLSSQPPQVLAMPDFDMPTRTPKGAIRTQTILLTRNDSTVAIPSTSSGDPESSWQTKLFTTAVPSGVNVAAGNANIVGFSIKFKPGHAYDTSSVMLYQNSTPIPAGTKRANYFGYTFYQDGGSSQIDQIKYYTNSLLTLKLNPGTGAPYRTDYVHQPVSTSWQGFISGNALNSHDYLISGFKLTTSVLGVNELNNNNFAMSNVYPNPAKVSEGAIVTFNLKSGSAVTIEIYNVMGQLVKTVVNKNFNSGESNVDINLSGINAGVYFLNMTSNGITTTKKLTVIQ